jgi:membrane protein DedA with SNARE-associated domain
MGHWLTAAFASYGYAVVVIAIYVEGCGIPLPGETVLLAGGFFARQGSLSLPWVLVLGFAAAAAGDNSGYWIGRRGGRAWVESHGRWVGLTPRRLDSIAEFFARHGAKTLLLARFLSGVRAFTPLFAGISGIPWQRFAAFDAAACLLWAGAVGLLGYGFGESWTRAEHVLGRAGLSLLVIVAVLLLLRIARQHRDRLVLWVRESLPGHPAERQLWLVIAQLTALGALGRLAGRVVVRRSTHFDDQLTHWLVDWTGPLAGRLAVALVALGSAPVVLAVVLLATAWCFSRRRRTAGFVLLAQYLASLALSIDLSRALTWWTGALGLFSGLLSGNALVAATVFGATGLLLGRELPRWRWPTALLTGAFVLLIGWARIQTDLDLPTGVLTGLAVSSLLLLIGNYALERREAASLQGSGTPDPPRSAS